MLRKSFLILLTLLFVTVGCDRHPETAIIANVPIAELVTGSADEVMVTSASLPAVEDRSNDIEQLDVIEPSDRSPAPHDQVIADYPVVDIASSQSPISTSSPVYGTETEISNVPPETLPRRDLYDLARSLIVKSTESLPPLNYGDMQDLSEGYRETFNLVDMVHRERTKIPASLKLVSRYAYWFVQDGVAVSREDLEGAAREFDNQIYPLVTRVFGPLWPTAEANGNRITILNANFSGVLGYYSAADEYPNYVHETSNQRKIIYMNSAFLDVGGRQYLSTLGHELQHAVNWNLNKGQETWLSEGLSQLAEYRLGYIPDAVGAFSDSYPVSLVYWPLNMKDTQPNYGAAFLFTLFLVDQVSGNSGLRSLVETGRFGISAIDTYLQSLNVAEDFGTIFSRWIVANYLGQNREGLFSYSDLEVHLRKDKIITLDSDSDFRQPQYSAQYIEVNVEDADSEVIFTGEEAVPVFVPDPPALGHCWWSNRGDSISTSMTRKFDLSHVARAELHLRMAYEIEEEWDYAYVEISTDDGVTWDIIRGGLSSERNPIGNSYGSGYSGITDGWVEDVLDLDGYIGSEVLLRFHYITDDAIGGSGLCLDTISIPELGFYDDASQDQGWITAGFSRIDNRVSQEYHVWLIESEDGHNTMTKVELDDVNKGQATLHKRGSSEKVLLVVGSSAKGSSQPANYSVLIKRP